MNNHILLTGASGFVGSRLATELVHLGATVKCAVRSPVAMPGVLQVIVPTMDMQTTWGQCLEGMDTIIHCAGRAHVMHDLFADPLPEYRRVNVGATINLARQAAAAGVKRFIFLSSIKVNGEETEKGQAYSEKDAPNPQNPYAISKYEAEQALLELAAKTKMDVVIIRPTLIYGEGVKANFRSMLKLVQSGIPLPFGAIDNKRSFVYSDNLNSLIFCCIENPRAANQIFFVSDGHDLSTPELLRSSAQAMGVSSYLIPVPQSWCVSAASLIGRGGSIRRLCSSLQVDISKAEKLLGWRPLVSVEIGLQKTVRDLL